MTDQHGPQEPAGGTTDPQPSLLQPPTGLDYPPPSIGKFASHSRADYAEWGTRVRARLIDQGPTYLGVIVFLVGYAILIGELVVSDVSTVDIEGAAVAMIIGLGVMIASLGWVTYNRWITGGRTGQSLGKRVTKIRLIGEETNAPIGAKNACIRDLVHILDALTIVGYLWPLWHEKRQTFADQIMKTIVINEGDDNTVAP
jgi:uncharacterized RDD family membrane protein YckC